MADVTGALINAAASVSAEDLQSIVKDVKLDEDIYRVTVEHISHTEVVINEGS